MSLPEASFEDVVTILREERTYQHEKWGIPGEQQSILGFIGIMEDYLAEAKHLQARNSHDVVETETMDTFRKITALGVACLEAHGITHRIPNE